MSFSFSINLFIKPRSLFKFFRGSVTIVSVIHASSDWDRLLSVDMSCA